MRREWRRRAAPRRPGCISKGPEHFKSGDIFIRPNKRESSTTSFRRDVNENCSLGIDCSYQRCAYGRLNVTTRYQLNYAIHARRDNSRIHPGSLLTPIDRQSFNFCRKWIARPWLGKVESGAVCTGRAGRDCTEKAINQFVLLLDRSQLPGDASAARRWRVPLCFSCSFPAEIYGETAAQDLR